MSKMQSGVFFPCFLGAEIMISYEQMMMMMMLFLAKVVSL
jgi:hypothetical protein